MAKKKKTTKQSQNIIETNFIMPNWLPILTFIALGILIFYPPFFRGLFFKEDIFVFHILTALVFTLLWVQKIYKKDYTLLKTPLDFAILAYVGAYLLSLIGAVHPGEAFYGFLRVLNLFMIYSMVTTLVKDYRTYENILKIILAAGTGVAVIGILAATGYSNYPSAFDGRVILSTLQYPNTTAAYLAVISLLAISLIIIEKRLLTKIVYLSVTFLMILVILCTLSKGAWLIFVIGALLLLAGMPGLHKISSLYSLGIAFLAAGITYTKFQPAIVAQETALPYLLIGLIIVVVGQLAWEAFLLLNKRINSKITIIAVTLIALITIGIGSTFFLGGSSFEATDISKELARFTNLKDSSYTARADFIQWGVNIIKDYPINGTGAGGWNALYHQYQDYLAFTTEAHNHFIQVGVEAGLIGLVGFIAIWILLFIAVYKTYQQEKTAANASGQILVWGTFTAALAFGIHAAMDFDLSLAAMALLLWILFALISAASDFNPADTKETSRLRQLHPALSITIVGVCILTLIIPGSSSHFAYKNGVKAATAMHAMAGDISAEEQNEYFQTALKHYEKAARLDSHNAEYLTDLAYAYAIRYTSLKEMEHPLANQAYHETIVTIEKAEKLKPYDVKVRSSLMNTASMLGEFQLMLRQAEGAIAANPNDINAYDSLAKILIAGLEYYKTINDAEQIKIVASQLANLEDRIESQKAKINPEKPWGGSPLNPNREHLEIVAQANYQIGEYQKSLDFYDKYFNNLIKLEFADTDFANTYLENDNWSVTTINDEDTADNSAIKVVAKVDMGGWPTVISLASQLPVQPATEYILEVRYRIDNLTHGTIADTSNTFGIWGSTKGSAEAKNTSFGCHSGEINTPTTWKVAQQKLTVDSGHKSRDLRIGTGSIGAGSTFYIDYVKLYPVLSETTPKTIIEPYTWYAASLYKTGKITEANKIAEQLRNMSEEMYNSYMELIK